MKKKEKVESDHVFLIEEFKQAWEHYRHMENTRAKFMNFFYTVLFGITGVSLAVLKDFDKKYLKLEALGVCTLLYFMNIFTIYIYSNIKKTGFVLKHYEDIMYRIRILIYEDENTVKGLFSIREKKHNVMKLKIFSVQSTAEYILTSFMYLIDLFILVLLINFQRVFNYPTYIIASLILALVFLFIFKTILFFKGNSKTIVQSS